MQITDAAADGPSSGSFALGPVAGPTSSSTATKSSRVALPPHALLVEPSAAAAAAAGAPRPSAQASHPS